MSEDRADPAEPDPHFEPDAEDTVPSPEPARPARHFHHAVGELTQVLKARQEAIRKSFRTIDHAVDDCFKGASLKRQTEAVDAIIDEAMAELEAWRPSPSEAEAGDTDNTGKREPMGGPAPTPIDAAASPQAPAAPAQAGRAIAAELPKLVVADATAQSPGVRVAVEAVASPGARPPAQSAPAVQAQTGRAAAGDLPKLVVADATAPATGVRVAVEVPAAPGARPPEQSAPAAPTQAGRAAAADLPKLVVADAPSPLTGVRVAVEAAAAPGARAPERSAPAAEKLRAVEQPSAPSENHGGQETRAESAPLETEMKAEAPQPSRIPPGMKTIDADTGPIKATTMRPGDQVPANSGGGGYGGNNGTFHKRLGPIDFNASLRAGINAVRKNLLVVMLFTIASNALVLAIPIYLFQISDRVLTSRSLDTLVMLTILIVGAVILQSVFDAVRRCILMRTAVEVAAQLGAPILSAAARASLHGNGREYQTLGDLNQVRSFLVSRTLLSFLDAPIAPIFIIAVFLVHPHLGWLVVITGIALLTITLINQRATEAAFSEANVAQSKANLHLDSMARNSQIINALAMIPEAVQIWGKDTAASLKAQVVAQDRNIYYTALSKGARLICQVAMLGWGAYLAIEGEITGGMVIAGSIIAGRALAPIEGAIEGWNQFTQSRAAYGRITALLKASPLNFERLQLPRPEGRLDVERLLYVPQGTKRVVLNGISFALQPGDSLAIIGNSGAGKTTLGKMLVGSILPTSGSVRLDLMDLRNWDQRQFGENIGYLPQDVQLFPGTIKANIARMREDATDEQIYEAAMLADVHEMIANLPHGYETIVAADGSPLSGGQKQRIALARAFFGNPRMVILDEPNSNLDSAGDAALMRALAHAKANKITVATITQRPSLLSCVDKVLLLVNGTVALFGRRQDVLDALASRGISIESGSFGHQLQ